jgi:hypothetical protein
MEGRQVTPEWREAPAVAIRGIDKMSLADVENALRAGACFVIYEYCISLFIVTLRRPSDIFFLRPEEIGILRGLPYVFLSFLLGWWGVPWGFVYTPLTIITNLSGGCDVTEEVWALLQSSPH